jgi:integrase
MAALVTRPRRDGSVAYKVQWRLGGARQGLWQSETFDDRREALRFQTMVEAHGELWPTGWVKGWGFSAPPALPSSSAGTLLVTFGLSYVRRLTSAGPDTQTRYLAQVSLLSAWITDATGKVPTLEAFTSDDDRDWINARRRAGASPKTIANYHGLLAAIFKDAVAKDLIAKNPCQGVRLPVRDFSNEEVEDTAFLTEEEFVLLRSCTDADSRDLLTVAVGTGLRWGELTALRGEDLVLTGRTPHLLVRRAWKRNGTGDFAVADEGRFYLGSPKTRESRRRVSLARPVVEVLKRVTRGKRPGDLVFPGPDGGRLDQGTWYASRWQPAVRAARTAGMAATPRFHDLRHTHAAWLISAGVPLPVIQKRLGHKSIKITVDVYGGLLVQTHEAADEAVTRALGGRRIAPAPAPDRRDEDRAAG